MPKRPNKSNTDIGQLEKQIENLRDIVSFLFCIVLTLTVYMILQLFQQGSISFFIPYGLALAIVLILLLLCTGWSLYGIYRKEDGIPAGI